MKSAVLAVLLLTATLGHAEASTIWQVDYFLTGDISTYHTFYAPGSYDFLLRPGFISVYQLGDGCCFLGYYGSVTLPADLPPIVFPAGTDQAVAYLVDPPDPTAVPEPSTLALIAVGCLALAYARRRAASRL